MSAAKQRSGCVIIVLCSMLSALAVTAALVANKHPSVRPITNLVAPLIESKSQREATASKKFKIAMSGEPEKLLRRCERICEDFPDTETAIQAKVMVAAIRQRFQQLINEEYKKANEKIITDKEALVRIERLNAELAKNADEVDKEP